MLNFLITSTKKEENNREDLRNRMFPPISVLVV